MATIHYRSTESAIVAVAVHVTETQLKLRYCMKGEDAGSKVSPFLAGLNVEAGSERKFALRDLHALNEWSERSTWLFPALGVEVGDPVNLFAETASSKRTLNSWFRSQRMLFPFRLFVPTTYSRFTDMGMGVIINKSGRIVTNLSKKQIRGETFDSVTNEIFPQLRVEGPRHVKAEETFEITVKATTNHGRPFNGHLNCYLSSTAGYLAKQKILVKNGEASVKSKALLLDPGDEMVVRAGFKFFSSVATHKIQIS